MRTWKNRAWRGVCGAAAILLLLSAAEMARAASAVPNVHVGGFTWWDDRYVPTNLADNSTGSYWFDSSPSSDTRWLLFNLNGLYSVEKMSVYNYAGSEIGRQMKTAPIEYSVDGTNWALVETHTFKRTAEGWDDISFGNVQARLVRIGSPTNGYANYGEAGEIGTGLSEVTFYGIGARPRLLFQVATTAITATAASYYPGRPPEKAADGSGLLADADGDGIPPHDTDINNMWTSAAVGPGQLTNQWIQFKFNVPVPLDHMRVWNFNYPVSGGLEWSLKKARIRYSVNGTDWTTLVEEATITRALGNNAYEAVDRFGFGGALVQYVRFDNLWNFRPQNEPHVGLSEVQFFGRVPPKGTVVSFK